MGFAEVFGVIVGIIAIIGVLVAVIAFIREHPDVVPLLVTASIVVIVIALAAALLVSHPWLSSSTSASGQDTGATTATATSESPGNPTSVPQNRPTDAPTNTPTPPAPGTILYQADWSGGMNGWSGGPQWKVSGGMLLNDGSGGDNGGLLFYSAIAPYMPVTADYAVVAQIQVVYTPTRGGFGVFAREEGDNGYVGGVDEVREEQPYSGDADIHTQNAYAFPEGGGSSPVLGYVPFTPGTAWHTYRLEVKGNHIKLLIDNHIVVEATDNSLLDSGQVGIEAYVNMQISVSSFEVIAL